MHTVWFQAEDPLNTLPRALDVVRRMGFELCGLHVEDAVSRHGEAVSGAALTFRVGGGRTAANLAERLRQIPGVAALTWRRGAPDAVPLPRSSQQRARTWAPSAGSDMWHTGSRGAETVRP